MNESKKREKTDKKDRLHNLHEYEKYLQDNLSKKVRDYYHSGANDMITLRENRAAFSRLTILPRVLIDVSRISTKISILGKEVPSPICIAPSAMQRMTHPDGELATSRATARFGTVMTLSSLSTTSLEDVIAAPIEGHGNYWFQLYSYKNQEITKDLIRRAESSGYQAIVLTVDTPMLGRREPDLRNHFSLPSHLSLENFSKYYNNHQNTNNQQDNNNRADSLIMDSKPTLATTTSNGDGNSAVANYFALLINDALTWDETIHWIKANTSLKIVLKGIITPEDAVKALDYPVDAIWISNHGARQLDTTPATIEALPGIAAAVRGRLEVYVDGGITRGTDVLKALALGANAVFLGRPVLWGLSYDGEDGLFDVLSLLQEELVLAMKLAGCIDIRQLRKEIIRPKLYYQSNL